jgi:hypothetical protein
MTFFCSNAAKRLLIQVRFLQGTRYAYNDGENSLRASQSQFNLYLCGKNAAKTGASALLLID